METKLSNRKCLQSARMLVPKMAYENEGKWHIHWPCDQPRVIHADSKEALEFALAAWLKEIGRVANQGEHIEPEYP